MAIETLLETCMGIDVSYFLDNDLFSLSPDLYLKTLEERIVSNISLFSSHFITNGVYPKLPENFEGNYITCEHYDLKGALENHYAELCLVINGMRYHFSLQEKNIE